MNTEHPTSDRLQRDLDGDLSTSQSAELRSHVAECASCARQQTAQKRLQQLIAHAVAEQADAIDLSGMFAKIEAGIAAESVSESRPNGHDARAAPEGKPSAVVPIASAPAKVRHFTSAVPLLGAFALAAAVMLMVYRPDGSLDVDDGSYETDGGRSEVTDIEFGRSAGTVFDIAMSDGSSTPVVWIDDDGDDDDDQE